MLILCSIEEIYTICNCFSEIFNITFAFLDSIRMRLESTKFTCVYQKFSIYLFIFIVLCLLETYIITLGMYTIYLCFPEGFFFIYSYIYLFIICSFISLYIKLLPCQLHSECTQFTYVFLIYLFFSYFCASLKLERVSTA